MRESAQAALTLARSRATRIGIEARWFDQHDLHVHLPAGAIPKDGPSAGAAMFIALASLFTDRPVQHDVAMTGEVSLRGLVLPVGGIEEKVLAAQHAGLHTVLLPERKLKDLREVTESARAAMRFVGLQTVDDAIRAALADPAAPGAPPGSKPG
jgi:ATP-dependent Lon protease